MDHSRDWHLPSGAYCVVIRGEDQGMIRCHKASPYLPKGEEKQREKNLSLPPPRGGDTTREERLVESEKWRVSYRASVKRPSGNRSAGLFTNSDVFVAYYTAP